MDGNSISASCRQQLLYQKGFCWVIDTPKTVNIADGRDIRVNSSNGKFLATKVRNE